MSDVETEICNVEEWIEENKSMFLPPVCNKLMHENQLNIMFVGGPNERSDYHIENGEELFLQLKGDMMLKVVEKNRHRDIIIKEGEIFFLPRAIPHSPQRFANTIGLVVERSRTEAEVDGLRFYVKENGVPSTISLYEMWFQWDKERDRMPEFFEQFFNSEQYKTGKPVAGTIPDKSPTEVDTKRSLVDPFSLNEWIDQRRQIIDERGRLPVNDVDRSQLQVYVYGKCDKEVCLQEGDTWIWQRLGSSDVSLGSKSYILGVNDSILVPVGQPYRIKQDVGSIALTVSQVPFKPGVHDL